MKGSSASLLVPAVEYIYLNIQYYYTSNIPEIHNSKEDSYPKLSDTFLPEMFIFLYNSYSHSNI